MVSSAQFFYVPEQVQRPGVPQRVPVRYLVTLDYLPDRYLDLLTVYRIRYIV